MMKYEIIVELKPEVLDVQGRAITNAISHSIPDALNSVKVSKRYILESRRALNEAELRSLAQDYFANTVSEQFNIRPL